MAASLKRISAYLLKHIVIVIIIIIIIIIIILNMLLR